VLDLDVKAYFDSIDWELLLRAVRRHTNCPWVLLYIERWLKAPVQLEGWQRCAANVGNSSGRRRKPHPGESVPALHVRYVDEETRPNAVVYGRFFFSEDTCRAQDNRFGFRHDCHAGRKRTRFCRPSLYRFKLSEAWCRAAMDRAASSLSAFEKFVAASEKNIDFEAWEKKYFDRFDTDKAITLTGVVKEFQWSNPRARIMLTSGMSKVRLISNG